MKRVLFIGLLLLLTLGLSAQSWAVKEQQIEGERLEALVGWPVQRYPADSGGIFLSVVNFRGNLWVLFTASQFDLSGVDEIYMKFGNGPTHIWGVLTVLGSNGLLFESTEELLTNLVRYGSINIAVRTGDVGVGGRWETDNAEFLIGLRSLIE